MNDSLIDDDRLSLERQSVLPGEGFFIPDSIEVDRADEEAAESLSGSDVAVVADPDADGLACAALIREAYGEVALLGVGPHELRRGLERAAEYGEEGVTLFVCDLCPDAVERLVDPIDRLVERSDSVRWFDHHQWKPTVVETVRDLGVDLVVGRSDEECSADVALRELEYDFPDRFVGLVAATRDHDLWIRDDPRSDDLADYAHWTDPEEYVEVVRKHGADLPTNVQQFLAEKRIRKNDRIDRAVSRADFHDIGPITVGVTYGRCSQNEVAEALREQGADAAVIVKPAGSASLRGSETFERCHEVARQVNGGGHPRAAGCKPDIYDDMLDYAHHWTTRGAVTKQVILDAVRGLYTDPADDSA